jgi:hypothetical protein
VSEIEDRIWIIFKKNSLIVSPFPNPIVGKSQRAKRQLRQERRKVNK